MTRVGVRKKYRNKNARMTNLEMLKGIYIHSPLPIQQAVWKQSVPGDKQITVGERSANQTKRNK